MLLYSTPGENNVENPHEKQWVDSFQNCQLPAQAGSVRSVGLLFLETALVFQAHFPVSVNIHDNIWCQGEDRQDSTLFEYLRD